MATYYIDPSAAINGNGTKENPYNTWMITSWSGHTAAPGNNYLQKKGTTWSGAGSSTQTNRNIAWSISGDSNNLIVIGSYDDPKNPSAGKPKLQPSAGITSGIVFATNVHHVIVDGLELSGHSGKFIENGGSTNTNDISITIKNCYIHDSSAEGNGIDLRGQNCKVLDCVLENIGMDGIWLDSNNAEVARTNVKSPSTFGLNGDCVQFSGTSGNVWVHDCVFDHRNVDSKHCIIVSTMTASYKGGVIEDNICYGYLNGSVNKPIYIGSQELIVRRNRFFDGFNNSVTGDSTDNANNSFIYSNIFENQASYNLDVYAVTTPVVGLKIYNNTFKRSLNTLASIRNNFNSNQADYKNNIFINSNNGIEIRSLDSHSNNLFYGQSNFPIFNAQTGLQVAIPSDSLSANPLLDVNYNPAYNSPVLSAGVKWWTNARPSSVDGEPLPDVGIDLGAKQSNFHPFHPYRLT